MQRSRVTTASTCPVRGKRSKPRIAAEPVAGVETAGAGRGPASPGRRTRRRCGPAPTPATPASGLGRQRRSAADRPRRYRPSARGPARCPSTDPWTATTPRCAGGVLHEVGGRRPGRPRPRSPGGRPRRPRPRTARRRRTGRAPGRPAATRRRRPEAAAGSGCPGRTPAAPCAMAIGAAAVAAHVVDDVGHTPHLPATVPSVRPPPTQLRPSRPATGPAP